MDSLPSRASGNAFVYVLVSVVLLAALSFAISRGNDSDPSNEISTAAAKANATSILAYESQARMAIDQMLQSGASINNIDFTMPSNAGFNTAPTSNKLFHPDGGGLQYKPLPAGTLGALFSGLPSQYYVGRFNNVEWTPTTAQDIIFSAVGLNKNTCEEINRKIFGTATMPTMAAGDITQALVSYDITGDINIDLTASKCTNCKDKAATCVKYNAGEKYIFYSVLVAR